MAKDKFRAELERVLSSDEQRELSEERRRQLIEEEKRFEEMRRLMSRAPGSK